MHSQSSQTCSQLCIYCKAGYVKIMGSISLKYRSVGLSNFCGGFCRTVTLRFPGSQSRRNLRAVIRVHSPSSEASRSSQSWDNVSLIGAPFSFEYVSWNIGGGCSAMSWWRHQMETFSALLAICAGNSPVPGEFPAQRPVTRSFDVFFDLRLNKRLSKQSWGWWFETLSRPLWLHCNVWR